jgi:hypothetical protein
VTEGFRRPRTESRGAHDLHGRIRIRLPCGVDGDRARVAASAEPVADHLPLEQERARGARRFRRPLPLRRQRAVRNADGRDGEDGAEVQSEPRRAADWSRPVASTRRTSGSSGSSRTTASSSAPSRAASSPGSYAAPAAPVTLAPASSRPARRSTAPAQPLSPAAPGPDGPRGKHTKHPPERISPARRHGSVRTRPSRSCSAISSARELGQPATDQP